MLAAEPYLARFGRVWLVGHVALRRVPRVAVLWQFIVETFARTAS